MRVLRWAQAARGVAPSTISHNIEDVAALLRPDLSLPSTTGHVNNGLRNANHHAHKRFLARQIRDMMIRAN